MTDLRKAAEMALKTLENQSLKKDEHLLAVVEEALRQALAQPEQENYVTEVVAMHENGTYTTKRMPVQKREWVGLTDDEIYDYADKFLYQHGSNYGIRSFGKAVEARLKEKNT